MNSSGSGDTGKDLQHVLEQLSSLAAALEAARPPAAPALRGLGAFLAGLLTTAFAIAFLWCAAWPPRLPPSAQPRQRPLPSPSLSQPHETSSISAPPHQTRYRYKFSIKRFSQRHQQRAAMQQLSQLDAGELRRLLGEVGVPSWVSSPDRERVQWLQAALVQLWPFAAQYATQWAQASWYSPLHAGRSRKRSGGFEGESYGSGKSA